MPRPNWFLAFPVEGSFLADLPAPPPRFRLFPREDVHLTLVFLGGCGKEAAEKAFARLEGLVAERRIGRIPVTLGDVAPLGGSRRDYTALSALLEGGREEASACIAELRDPITEAAGLRRQLRPPKPHVTLGRPPRRANPVEREAGLAWAAQLDLKKVSRTLDRVALYTWTDDRRERLFQITAELALR
ncbi:MAG TPA: 2'-5' RNA ligase family protein [Polyangiaceae bacterium]